MGHLGALFAALRSLAVSTLGAATGPPVSWLKNGLRRYAPVRRALMIMAIVFAIPLTSPADCGLSLPIALLTPTTMVTGPNDALRDWLVPSRQVWIRPTKEARGLAGVLPMGVLQHAEYQRSMPVSVRRRQARCSAPRVNVRFDGGT